MFIIQPGMGLGFTGSREIALALDGGVGVVVAEVEFGGHQFLEFRKIFDEVAQEIQVDEKVLPFLQITETEFEIDGKSYTMVGRRTPSEIISTTADIDKILDRGAKSMGITRREAKRVLFDGIIKELKKVETIKQSVFNDDDEIIMILVATDDI